MATLSTETLNGLAHDICYGEARLPGATLSGIVPDQAHLDEGGYHVSREDQVNWNDYSIRLWIDKQGPSNRAAAIDRSMPTASMIVAWNRWMLVFNDLNHPARKYVREYIGWNGVGEAERLDFANQTRTVAHPSHRWHDHESIYRAYVHDPEMRRVVRMTHMGYSASAIRGDVVPVPNPQPGNPIEYEEEDMKPLYVYCTATASQGVRWGVGVVSGGETLWLEAASQDEANAYAAAYGTPSLVQQGTFDSIKSKFVTV